MRFSKQQKPSSLIWAIQKTIKKDGFKADPLNLKVNNNF